MVVSLSLHHVLQVLDVFFSIVESVCRLAIEVSVSQLKVFVLLRESTQLVLQSNHLGIEDAACCYFVFNQLLNLNVFTVINAF